MDGLRKCFAEEFTEIYLFNLRGNQRTQGEISRREGGKIFGSGSRAPIAITILVKRAHEGSAKIFYREMGDYLSREEKLAEIERVGTVLSDFEEIFPNERCDWVNQRGNEFETFISLCEVKNLFKYNFYMTRSNGVQTARDAWCYNFSRSELEKNIRTTIDYYNTHEPTEIDSKKISWTRGTVQNKNRGREIEFNAANIIESIYRPFCKANLYYDRALNEYVFKMPKFFPSGKENLLICVPDKGTKDFSVLIVDKIPCYDLIERGQCFPLYYYEAAAQGNLFGEEMTRRDGISDWILSEARKKFGADVSKEDIFYYVYGFLHLPAYREKFSAELKKSLPRIILSDKFWELSRAGRALAAIHLNYEAQEPPAQVEVIGGGDFGVKKLRFAKDDRTTLIYNDHITIKNIPPRSFEYVVNGRSPLEWIIDRYQIKEDKASGIVNNPNDWSVEHGNPRYILDLILSSITLSLKTLDIVENLPDIKF